MKEQIIRMLPLTHKPQVRQFYRFAVVGVMNTAIDFIIYYSLTRLSPFFYSHYIFASAISFTIAVTNSFIWNRRWTFKSTDQQRTRQYTKFLMVNLTALLLNSGLLYVFIHLLGIFDLFAKVCSVGILMFWNFFINRIWVFRTSALAQDDQKWYNQRDS